MKKNIVTSIVALAFAAGAYAQGTVNWGATAVQGNVFTAQTNSTAYSPLFGGGSAVGGSVGLTSTELGGFYYAVLYTSMLGYQTPAAAPTTVAELSAWTASNLTATNRSTAGQVLPENQSNAKDIGWASGTTNSIMMVGWSANLGTSWSAALANLENPSNLTPGGNYFFGMSTIGYINPSTSLTLGVSAFSSSGAATTYGVPIKSLNTQLYLVPTAVVPEPSTIALAGLGGLAMLALRRRK